MSSKDSAFVTAVNFMLERCRSVRRINSLEEFGSEVIVELCERLLGQPLQGILRDANGRSDEEWNVQLVIDALSIDILHSDLSHITGEKIVAKDKISIKNLVEIFSGLMEILLEATEVAAGGSEGSPSPDDSNILSSDAMSVVSSVLQQELGPSYKPEMLGGLRQARERRRDVADVMSETESSSSNELARVEATHMSRDVVAVRGQITAISSSSSLFSESEQEVRKAVFGHTVTQIPSVSSIASQSDLSENGALSVRRSLGGVARPISSTPRKASRRVIVHENGEVPVKPHWERGEFTDKSSSSKNEQDTVELVNEALEGQLSQHTMSSTNESTSSLIRIAPKQNTVRRFKTTAVVEAGLSVASQTTDLTQERQQSEFTGHVERPPVGDHTQPQLQTALAIQQQHKETRGVETQTEAPLPDVTISPLNRQDDINEELEDDLTLVQPVEIESSDNSFSSQPSSVKESCNESEHEAIVSYPSNTVKSTQSMKDDPQDHRHSEETDKLDQGAVGSLEAPVIPEEPLLDVLSAKRDDSPVDVTEQPVASLSLGSHSAAEGSAMVTYTPTRLRHLAAAAEGSEAARKVGGISEARRQLSLEDALQRDRTAVLRTVYGHLLRDSEQGQEESDTPRCRLGNGRRKKQVTFHTPAKTIKPTKPSPSVCRKKSDHGRKSPGSPYAQPVIRVEVKRSRHRRQGNQAKAPYVPLSDQPKVRVRDNELLPLLVDEFPFLHVSPATVQQMWRKQMNQIQSITRAELDRHYRPKAAVRLEEAEHKQRALLEVMKKDVEHTRRMREQQERDRQMRYVKARLQEKRQSAARAKRYYDDYVTRMRTRQMKRRTKEEQIFKKLFEDGIEIQRLRLRELKQYAKGKREEQTKRQQDEIASLENYYQDQFAMLAGSIAEEQRETQIRDDAQAKVVNKMRRELRSRMEKEIQDLQEAMIRGEDDAYFRQLDADRLRNRLQTAYYYTKL